MESNSPKIALAQIEIYAGQPARNAEKILNFIEQAINLRADMIIFPAMAISGAMIGEDLQRESFLRDCQFFNEKIIAASKKITIVFDGIEADYWDWEAARIFVARDGKIIKSKNSVYNIKLGGKKYRMLCRRGEFVAKNFPPEQVDFCVNIASTPFRIGQNKLRDENFSSKAKELNCPIIYVNATGIQNCGKVIYTYEGNSTVYNSRGKIVHGIEIHEEDLSVIELDEINNLPELELAEYEEIDEIFSAIFYGVEKFLQQINISKVVVGVSGGIDSAVAAALYTQILGAGNVYLVNMPSVFNSATTKNLSERLAKNLGCRYAVVPIQESVDFTVNQLESTCDIKISNFVKENIQARDRSGRILSAIAASIGGVFTCNANKAETTVGYATLYGDAAGFFCALADLWKFQVYALANYLNEKIFGDEIIPQGIIDIVPSAELSTAQNVDEGKGDPLKYSYHDYLFRAFVEDLKTPEDILQWYVDGNLEKNIGCEVGLVKKYFPTAKDFIADLERWWKLFTGIAVAKRLQAPPILAVSRRAYGEFKESQNIPYFTQAYKNLKETV